MGPRVASKCLSMTATSKAGLCFGRGRRGRVCVRVRFEQGDVMVGGWGTACAAGLGGRRVRARAARAAVEVRWAVLRSVAQIVGHWMKVVGD